MVKLPLASILLSLALCSFAGAQTQGSYTIFGTGCKGSNGVVPLISNTGVPTVGKTFSVHLTKALASTAAGFITGTSNTKWGSVPLPIDLKIVNAPGCFLLVSFETMFPVATDAQGAATVTANVPNDTSLVGLTFHQQFMVVDKTANALGLVFTAGGTGKMGS